MIFRAHVLENFLTSWEKEIKCEAIQSILSLFGNKFNTFKVTGTLNVRFYLSFDTKSTLKSCV